MRHLFPGLALIAALALPAAAQETAAVLPETRTMTDATPLPAAEADLGTYLWTARPVVVFADTDADPRFIEQMELLERDIHALEERDVVVITDTDPAARSAIRQKLRPRGFMLVLIGKDGGIKLRKPSPWDVRELSRVIDKMPMRQQELRER